MTKELIIALYWNTDYHSIEDTKNQMLIFQLTQTSHFLLCVIIPPP